MQNPDNIRALPVAEDLAVEVYRITRNFPREERFGLCAQMRRAAISIGSNIAEGCGRRGNRGLLAFVYIAIGSCNELAYQLRVSMRLGFVSRDEARAMTELQESVHRMLSKLAAQLAKRPDLPPDE